MKKTILGICLVSSFLVNAEVPNSPTPMCRVEVCNKLERFTLDIGNMISDAFSESCFEMVMPKSEAIPNKVLSSESRWWQGKTLNPTKKSVTRIKRVLECQ